jgi:hypothetical protein
MGVLHMKRYIFFHYIILLCLSHTLYLNTMEIEPVQDTVCYLTLLPVELLNYICQLLLWETETEEELIRRTGIEKNETFPKSYYRYFGCKNSLGIENIVGVFSPDKNKIALFERFCEDCANPYVCNKCISPQFIIVDLNPEKEEDRTLFAGFLKRRYYRTIGISCSGNMYAAIKIDIKNKEIAMESRREYQDVMVIRDIKNNRKRNFEIPDDFIVSRLMFNKQGTCVIAYTCDDCCASMQKKYLLFDLKNDVDKTIIVEEKKNEQNWLLDYFRHNRVCQNIKQVKK